MGISILELVLRRLREENFQTEAAFPGKKYPDITRTVAAAHIQEVNRADRTVTVEVMVFSPGTAGGSVCEAEALRATEALHSAGAECVQGGCQYNGTIRAYCVSILATFVGVTMTEDCTMGPGFTVYISNSVIPWTTAFTAEKTEQWELCYGIGENTPVDIAQGKECWKILLEEKIPVGSPVSKQAVDSFSLRLERSDGYKETYYRCRWLSEKRYHSREGLHRIRTGIAMQMEEEVIT